MLFSSKELKLVIHYPHTIPVLQLKVIGPQVTPFKPHASFVPVTIELAVTNLDNPNHTYVGTLFKKQLTQILKIILKTLMLEFNRIILI